MSANIDFTKKSLTEVYGENCFSDSVMQERLPENVYKSLKAVQAGEKELTAEVAEVVANAMKDWAIEKGATHYTHWFQPLTGLTAEKHDSFISPCKDGTVMMEFSGKELIQGEPDASSFPNGGLRATFEARGYTAWDTTSPAVIKESLGVKTLTIPTAFISYTGDALDKKVPLLRSMQAINREVLRVLKALGNTTTKRIFTNVGPEQEYFLIDEEFYDQRPDLRLTGRTVFGTMSAKGQEMDDHYFGAIKERIAVFMKEMNYELWKLGISAKTQHNEVAPNQFEIATIFETANRSTDTNQLLMEVIKNVAKHHGMVALLHEKPFAGVNGSGKHNNWSIGTDDGYNLLKPGDSPEDNAQFLLFLTSVIKAVDEYAPLLRLSAANAGNDHRLGANEAPPAIISIFLGEQLSEILESIADDKELKRRDGRLVEVGLKTITKFPMDATDRNRTSPFAFTGNKFEFRMVGSSQSLAGPNAMLNAAVAEVLSEAADRLEKSDNVLIEVQSIIKEFYSTHRRVVFNGNGYGDEWLSEADKRGLPNLTSAVDAISHLNDKKYVELFSKHKIFSPLELLSRQDIYLETYSKQIHIEASIMVEMAKCMIVPASTRYLQEVIDSVKSQKELGISADQQMSLIQSLSAAVNSTLSNVSVLEQLIQKAFTTEENILEQAKLYREEVVPAMAKLRTYGDELEKMTDKAYWPYPSYEDMLFRL
ncbi:MAG: glutamine synthetase III [Spirochaetales bacterium]|jgi:glutamine synthetase|nr:glutamine synthetase III [Spirochaetales bacterium]